MTRKAIGIVVLVLVLAVGCDRKPDDASSWADRFGEPEAKEATPPAPPADVPPPPAPVETPPPVAAAPPAAAAAAADFKVGDRVYGKWTDDEWYPGRIAAINADGTYKVKYDDGDVSPKLPKKRVRARKASAGGKSGGKSGGGCGSGRMKCGGVCVDYRNDPKNCNACGRTCPEACMGGSCVSNAYKYGS